METKQKIPALGLRSAVAAWQLVENLPAQRETFSHPVAPHTESRMGIELVQANLLCPALPLEDLVAEGLVPGAMDMSSPSPTRALGNPSPHAFELEAARPFAVAARPPS